MLETLGGRKFIGFVLLLITGSGVAVAGNLTPELVGLFLGLYATYSAANAVVTSKTATAKPAEDLAPQIQGVLTQIGTALQTLQQGQQRNEAALNTLQASTASMQKGVGVILNSRQE